MNPLNLCIYSNETKWRKAGFKEYFLQSLPILSNPSNTIFGHGWFFFDAIIKRELWHFLSSRRHPLAFSPDKATWECQQGAKE